MTELFEVTAADIVDALRGSPWFCPVARALARHYPGEHVSVAACRIYRRQDLVATPSREMVRYILRFDNHGIALPRRFRIMWRERSRPEEILK